MSTGTARAFGGVLQFLLFVVVARSSGPSAAGVFAAFYAVVRVIGNLATGGSPQLLLRDVATGAKGVTAVADRLLLVIGLPTAIATAGTIGTLIESLRPAEVRISLGACIFFFAAVQNHAAIAAALERQVLSVVLEFIVPPLGGIMGLPVSLFAGYAGDPAVPFMWGLSLGYLVAALIGRVSLPHTSDVGEYGIPSRTLVRFAGISILTSGFWNAVVIVLALVLTEAELGFFSIAQRMTSIPTLFLFTINRVYSPTVAWNWAAGKVDAILAILRRSQYLSVALYSPFFILFIFAPEGTLAVLFGDEFRAAGLVLRLIAVGQFVNAATGLATGVLNMTGFEWVELRLLTLAIIATLVGVWLGGHVWGLTVAAVVFAAGTSLKQLGSLVAAQHFMHRAMAIRVET